MIKKRAIAILIVSDLIFAPDVSGRVFPSFFRALCVICSFPEFVAILRFFPVLSDFFLENKVRNYLCWSSSSHITIIWSYSVKYIANFFNETEHLANKWSVTE